MGRLSTNAIDSKYGNGTTDKLMCSFEFNAFNLCIELVILLITSFLISSVLPKLSLFGFYIYVFIILYSLFFNLFYCVSLIHNCIRISKIKNNYELNEASAKKSFFDIANEIRIDIILATLLNNMDSNIDIINIINEHTKMMNLDETTKKNLLEYFETYYKKDN